MENKMIRRLRNKIWFFLCVTFTAIMIFILTIIYLSNLSFLQQREQNLMWRDVDLTLSYLVEGSWGNPRNFAIKMNFRGEIMEIYGAPGLDISEAHYLRLNAEQQMWWGRIRNRFLWRIPSPFIEFENRHWVFATVSDRDWRQMRDFNYVQQEMQAVWSRLNEAEISIWESERMPEKELHAQVREHLNDREFEIFLDWFDWVHPNRYMIFGDVSFVFQEIAELQSVILRAGLAAFLTIITIMYFIANLLIKPIKLAFEQQKQFIADASHELKTPLTIIKSNFSVLEANEQATIGSQRKWLGNMAFGMERMSNLTADLLMLAQLENDVLVWEENEFNLGKEIEGILEILKPQFFEKKLQLTASITPEAIVYKNPDKLTQALMILLDNAIKYTEEGGWIEVLLTKNRQAVTVTIKNSGPGIAAHKLPKIFDRFYRGEESRTSEAKSYGLGLPIAKYIIDRSNGRLNASSIENKVTTFWFTLKN